MNRRLDLIIYAICLLLLVGAASLWWRGIFPSGDELVLTPEDNPAWGDLEIGPGQPGQADHPGQTDQAGQTGHPDPTPHGDVQGRQAAGRDSPDAGSAGDLPEEDDNVIFVHIAGAVEAPGVYKLKQGQRLYEALELAVPLEDADLDYLNLAGILYDQDKIYVPKKGEFSGCGSPVAGTSSPGQGSGYGTGGSGYGSSRTGSGSASAGVSFPININTATARELEALPGIGPAKAAAIIEFRSQRGPFDRKEDIKKVSGIGEATYSKIEPLITVR